MSKAEISPGPRLKERIESLCRDMVDGGILFSEAMENFERCFIMEVLSRNGGNLTRTADSLGIHRNTLSKRVHNRRHTHR